jgi:hypothetical protein
MSDNTHLRSFNPNPDTLTRRGGLRARASGLCTEIAGDAEQLGLLLDVSEGGLRLERPHTKFGGPRGLPRERVVQLEFEHPAVDELVWAKGVIRFDRLEPMRDGMGPTRVLRTSGVEIVAAAGKHLRLLRDFVLDLRASLREEGLKALHRSAAVEDAPLWSTAFRLG